MWICVSSQSESICCLHVLSEIPYMQACFRNLNRKIKPIFTFVNHLDELLFKKKKVEEVKAGGAPEGRT